jgi:hypothetical protein
MLCWFFYPSRWRDFRGYRTDAERFDVHDFVKASCVQRGIATQFLNKETFADQYQCRVWWWLSLALYVKAMRTPWVLNSLADDTAFVGLGFSIDPVAEKGRHVVLGCSHIYSGKGEGLQYRLGKVENPVFYGENPFMSKDDARRTGETIRQLFFDARFKLPERVVLHKRTHFTQDEREGLADGLSKYLLKQCLCTFEDDEPRKIIMLAVAAIKRIFKLFILGNEDQWRMGEVLRFTSRYQLPELSWGKIVSSPEGHLIGRMNGQPVRPRMQSRTWRVQNRGGKNPTERALELGEGSPSFGPKLFKAAQRA